VAGRAEHAVGSGGTKRCEDTKQRGGVLRGGIGLFPRNGLRQSVHAAPGAVFYEP
jgi:hypothetical protein